MEDKHVAEYMLVWCSQHNRHGVVLRSNFSYYRNERHWLISTPAKVWAKAQHLEQRDYFEVPKMSKTELHRFYRIMERRTDQRIGKKVAIKDYDNLFLYAVVPRFTEKGSIQDYNYWNGEVVNLNYKIPRCIIPLTMERSIILHHAILEEGHNG